MPSTYTLAWWKWIAIKHAHSRQNPEADWGLNVLQSIEFAFYVLNLEENFAASGITPANTTVIAASVSNGADPRSHPIGGIQWPGVACLDGTGTG
ncbi:MAG: hypothetical protein HC911_03740 [Chloroflexaceae bacterium]|nr:hypothetical protein [Chloroflexaceae bacterium]